MAEIVLTGEERMTDDAWPGVVAIVCPGWRIAVSGKLSGYRLQRRVDLDGGPIWCSVGGRSLPGKLVQRYADQVPGLAAAFSALPHDPGKSVPALRDAQADLELRYAQCRPTSPLYGRVVAEDSQMRIVVDPNGLTYLLQWAKAADVEAGTVDAWQTLYRSGYAQDLASWIVGKVYDPDDGGPWNANKEAIASRAARFIGGLPRQAVDGVWPKLPYVYRSDASL